MPTTTPQSPAAESRDEAMLIGCIAADTRDCMVPRLQKAGIEPAHFQNPYYALILDEAYKLALAGRPVDLSTLADAMRRTQAGERESLEALAEESLTPEYGPHYIRRLKGWYEIRRAKSLLASLVNEAEAVDADGAAEFITAIQARVCAIGTVEEDRREMADIAADVVAAAKNPSDTPAGIAWPWESWARLLDPITDELIYIAARPGAGKTAIALNILTAAAFGGHRVAIASLESSRERVALRLVQIIGGVDLRSMRNRATLTARWPEAEAAAEKLRTLPLTVTHNGMTPEQMFAWGKAEVAAGARLLVVDNMKNIMPSQRYNSTVEQFRDISARIAAMRNALGVSVVVLHHLNRGDQLSWSDDIERDADMVFVMDPLDDGKWTHYQSPNKDNGWTQSVRVTLRKNRDGLRGTFRMEFTTPMQRFDEAKDAAKPEEPF